MKTFRFSHLVVASLSLCVAPLTMAATWTFNTNTALNSTIDFNGASGGLGQYTNTYVSYNAGAIGNTATTNATTAIGESAPAVTASAWSNTNSSGVTNESAVGSNSLATSGTYKLESAYLAWWSGNGYGVENRDASTTTSYGDNSDNSTSNSEHSVDNNQRYDAVLFDFGSTQVNLSQVLLGWSSNDADITVLAYTGVAPTGNNTPTLTGSSYAQLTGYNGSSYVDGTGWTLINHYNNTATNSSTDVAVNTPNTVYSSYWLIGAANPLVGGPGASATSSGIDMVKILQLTGTKLTTNTTVPEPATLGLLGLGLLGMARIRRPYKQS